MNPWPVDERDRRGPSAARPGHADLVGTQKYGLSDVRDVLERASARETAARVAGGALAEALLRALGVDVRSHVTQIGHVLAPRPIGPCAGGLRGVDDDPVRCLDAAREPRDGRAHHAQRKANESIGGVWEVIVFGLVPGLGSHVSWEERLDGRLRRRGLLHPGLQGRRVRRRLRLRGGTRLPGPRRDLLRRRATASYRDDEPRRRPGGRHDDGRPLVARAAMKPLPTLTKPLRSIDLDTLEPAQALRERTDSCIVPRGGRRGGGHGRVRPGRRLPAQVRRRPRRRRSRRRRPLRGPHRVASPLRPALVFIGPMGAGKSSAAREAARDSA